MNDVQKLRLQNLKSLLDELRSIGLSKIEASEMFGFKNSSYLSQMLSGHRTIGEKTARKIEKAAGKAHLWLDQDDAFTPKQQEVIKKIRNFPDEHLYALSAFVDSLTQSNKKNQ